MGERGLQMIRTDFGLHNQLNIIPGMLCGDGKHDRRLPFQEGASGPGERSRTLRGSGHRLCNKAHISTAPKYNNICHSDQLISSQSLPPVYRRYPYLKPSFLYPAALAYQLAIGVIILLSHGRFTMKL